LTLAPLIAQHRAIEAALDLLPADRFDAEAFRRVHQLCREHYRYEEAFLGDVLSPKLRAQHEEALEIAENLEGALAADVPYLVRRFLAIVQHNIIEEERDFFPTYRATL